MMKIAYKLFLQTQGHRSATVCSFYDLLSKYLQSAWQMPRTVQERERDTPEFQIQLFTTLLFIRHWLDLPTPKYLIANTSCGCCRVLVFYVKMMSFLKMFKSFKLPSRQLKKAPDSSSPYYPTYLPPIFFSSISRLLYLSNILSPITHTDKILRISTEYQTGEGNKI